MHSIRTIFIRNLYAMVCNSTHLYVKISCLNSWSFGFRRCLKTERSVFGRWLYTVRMCVSTFFFLGLKLTSLSLCKESKNLSFCLLTKSYFCFCFSELLILTLRSKGGNLRDCQPEEMEQLDRLKQETTMTINHRQNICVYFYALFSQTLFINVIFFA